MHCAMLADGEVEDGFSTKREAKEQKKQSEWGKVALLCFLHCESPILKFLHFLRFFAPGNKRFLLREIQREKKKREAKESRLFLPLIKRGNSQNALEQLQRPPFPLPHIAYSDECSSCQSSFPTPNMRYLS